MVDAQAPGVAGMLRGLPGLLARDAWPEHLLHGLAGLHLLVAAHRGLDRLPDDLAATVRARVGYPVAKAAVLARPPVVDHWWAVGSVDSLDGRLETRRVWLWGAGTRCWAMLLSFAVPGAGLDESVAVGQVLDAAVHRYPGAAEDRVLLGEQRPVEPDPGAVGRRTGGDGRRRRAALGRPASRPTRGPRGCPRSCGPSRCRRPRAGEPWHLADPDGSAVRLVGVTPEPWPLLAASGGLPVDVFGEWSPAGFSPGTAARARRRGRRRAPPAGRRMSTVDGRGRPRQRGPAGDRPARRPGAGRHGPAGLAAGGRRSPSGRVARGGATTVVRRPRVRPGRGTSRPARRPRDPRRAGPAGLDRRPRPVAARGGRRRLRPRPGALDARPGAGAALDRARPPPPRRRPGTARAVVRPAQPGLGGRRPGGRGAARRRRGSPSRTARRPTTSRGSRRTPTGC